MLRRLALLACLVAVVGCDRAELDPVGAELLVSDPDLGVVQLEPDLTLRLLPPEFGGPLAVQVAGRPVPFDSAQGAYVLDLRLALGLNALPVSVTDDAGTVDRDTLYAVYLPIQPARLTGLTGATRRADAAASPVAPGLWIVSGGAGPDGRALATAEGRSARRTRASSRSSRSTYRRPGRATRPRRSTAARCSWAARPPTRPPAAPTSSPDAEWVGPDGRTVRVPVEGGAARTRHTARVLSTEDGTFLYLYGGVVPAGSGLARSGTVDVYRIDRTDLELGLTRLSPPGGSGAFPAVADHLQIPTGATSAAVRGRAPDGPVAFSFAWSRPGTSHVPVQPAHVAGPAGPAGGADAGGIGGRRRRAGARGGR